MQYRYQHRDETLTFLQNHLSRHRWELTLPSSGNGQETYIAKSDSDTFLIKLGAHVPHYQVMASLNLTPAVIMAGYLEDGATIMVQPYIASRNPSWSDFRFTLKA